MKHNNDSLSTLHVGLDEAMRELERYEHIPSKDNAITVEYWRGVVNGIRFALQVLGGRV
jgi:hypothetical protein